MRRAAIAMISVLALLLTAAGTSAARTRHAAPAKCAPSSHTLLADSQAQVYSHVGYPFNEVALWGCAYGQRRSVFITACNFREAAAACADSTHVVLAGAFIAYEYADVSGGKYPELEKDVGEWYIVVWNLRTGKVLHKAPTGTRLKPESGYVGVGNIVALVLKGDGSVAWIAEDYERSAAGPPVGPEGTRPSYFDVYACDKSGTRLLASGTNIDPSSLALSVGGTNIGSYPHTIAGSTLSWTQGGQSFSTTLN